MVFEERVGDRGQKGQRILNFLRVRICACVRKAFLENLCPQCPSVPIVFSLFNTSSNQSSLRQIEFKGKKWNIYNEFFWMNKDEILQLASDHQFDECYNDARTAKDRFVYQKLQAITLSLEAQAVLDKANEIVRSTFPFRDLFNGSNPEFQIMNWDCGWYQIKALAKEYRKNQLDEFNVLYKALADKMRPMVFALGFLK